MSAFADTIVLRGMTTRLSPWSMLTPGGNLSLYAQVSYIIREAVNCGAPPSMARMPITPEQVAEAYAARDAAKGQA